MVHLAMELRWYLMAAAGIGLLTGVLMKRAKR